MRSWILLSHQIMVPVQYRLVQVEVVAAVLPGAGTVLYYYIILLPRDRDLVRSWILLSHQIMVPVTHCRTVPTTNFNIISTCEYSWTLSNNFCICFSDVRFLTNHPPSPCPGLSEISKPPPLPIFRTS